MNDAIKCLVCGYTVLLAEAEGGVCRNCKPERRTRKPEAQIAVSKNQDEGGREETPPLSEKQGKLF